MSSEETEELPDFDSWSIFQGSLSLENKGSVARDHMASERTFLAWLRTSLSFITIGIGITQLFKLSNKTKVKINDSILQLSGNSLIRGEVDDHEIIGKALGAIFILIGIITLLFGFVRFFKVQHLLTVGYYPATRSSLVGLISLILIILVATFIVVVKTY